MSVILILSFANLFADGFRCQLEIILIQGHIKILLKKKKRMILDHLTDEEREEIRESYRNKGFKDELLDEIIRKRLIDTTFSCESYKNIWEKYYEKIKVSIFDSMSATQKRWITNLFKNFLAEKENFNFKYAIVHGDFDISNILVDPKSFKITGIVDFEDSRIYDP